MITQDVSGLKRAASRADYPSMFALARALYGTGQSAPDVLRACYGVALPAELFIVAEARAMGHVPPMLFTNQPWTLALPLAAGASTPVPNAIDTLERRVLNRDPQLMPLAVLQNPGPIHGDSILCYRLDELAAGRSTIIGLTRSFEASDMPLRLGDSFVTVLREHFGDARRQAEIEIKSPYNRGAGSIDNVEVDSAREAFARVERLERRVAATP